MGLSYFFVGLAANGHSVWGPQWADNHTFHQPYEATIFAALAAVGGVRYQDMFRADMASGGCSAYEAADPTWPAPGPNYVRIGTSGNGLPLYARADVSPDEIQFLLLVTRGTRDW